MSSETIIFQSIMQNGKAFQQLSNLVLDGVSTRADTSNTDAGKLYGNFTFGSGTYTLTLFSDLTKMDAVATATSSSLGSASISEVNGSGLSGTVNFAQYVADDNSIEVVCFLSQDSDLPMSNLEGLADYDDTVGFADYHLNAFSYLKDFIVTRYRSILFNPDLIDTKQINGGKGGYDLSRCMNLHVLREASAHYAFSRIAEKQAVEDNIFYLRSRDSKNLVKAFLTSVELQFDLDQDRVADKERLVLGLEDRESLMPALIVELPHDFEDQIFAEMQTMIERAVTNVVHEVPVMLKEAAMLDNLDVNGQQMPSKKPRPKRDPRNYPAVACFDTGNMMDKSRWTTEITTPTEAEVVYTPPDYFDAMVEKDPAHGGRPWMTRDRINDDVRVAIEEKMILALSDDGSPSQAGYGALPEGFELA